MDLVDLPTAPEMRRRSSVSDIMLLVLFPTGLYVLRHVQSLVTRNSASISRSIVA